MRECILTVPLGVLHGLRWGEPGQVPVLALHGWLDNAASFVPLAPYLPGLDLVALDLPGHGRSLHLPPGADYTHAAALHLVLDAADALGWERFSLLGHSMGASIASLVAAACPQRVQRLALIDGIGVLPETEARTVARMRESVAAARRNNAPLRVFADLATPIQARMQANALDEASARLLVERGVNAQVGGWAWSSDRRLRLPSFQRMTPAQGIALIAGITCPARAVFAHSAAPVVSIEDDGSWARWAQHLPHGEVFELPGIHHLHMQQPEAVAALLGGFLRGEPTASESV